MDSNLLASNHKILCVNGLKVELNDKDLTATILRSNISGDFLIPTVILNESQKYHVKTIADSAFRATIELKSLKFEEDSEISRFGKKCFYQSKIESLYIPASISYLEGFCDTTLNLKKIIISSQNRRFAFLSDSLLFSKNEIGGFENCTLLFARRDIEDVIVPSNVKRIGMYAFSSCTNLRSIKFETNENGYSNLEEIAEGGFSFCSQLISVCLPLSLKRIASSAFYKCINLSNVSFITTNLDNSFLEYIGQNAFSYTSLISFYFPRSIRIIDQNAFLYCKKLKKLKFNHQISDQLSICANAFFSCSLVKSILISSFNLDLGLECFGSCDGLISFECISNKVTIQRNCFDRCKNLTCVSFPCTKEFVIQKNAFCKPNSIFSMFMNADAHKI